MLPSLLKLDNRYIWQINYLTLEIKIMVQHQI